MPGAARKGLCGSPSRRMGTPRESCVAGDLNNWVPIPMRRQKNGTYVRVLSVPPGTHEYKYIVDGRWVVEPDHGVWAMNCYGTMSSVMTVT